MNVVNGAKYKNWLLYNKVANDIEEYIIDIISLYNHTAFIKLLFTSVIVPFIGWQFVSGEVCIRNTIAVLTDI